MTNAYIADFGLTSPADIEKTNQKICGVLPYMSPEVLNGKPYTKVADIYSFGMITYEVATGERPFGERSHDIHLVCDIYNGVRPTIPNNVPQLFKFIIEKCWDPIPENRPTAEELYDFIYSIYGFNLQLNTLHFQYYGSLEYPRTHEEIIECLKLEKQKWQELDEEMKLKKSIPTNTSKK